MNFHYFNLENQNENNNLVDLYFSKNGYLKSDTISTNGKTELLHIQIILEDLLTKYIKLFKENLFFRITNLFGILLYCFIFYYLLKLR